MFISFGSKLKKMSGMRFGFRLNGWTAFVMVFFYAIFYIIWYSLLGSLWIAYGTAWLIWKIYYFILIKPIKWIIRKIKVMKAGE